MSELRKKITNQFDDAVADIVIDDFIVWLREKRLKKIMFTVDSERNNFITELLNELKISSK